eukprot:scpid103761/ scgid18688/ 
MCHLLGGRETNNARMCATYLSMFIIVDVAELRCEVPSVLDLQLSHYSSYKFHTMVKGLVGASSNSTFTFIIIILAPLSAVVHILTGCAGTLRKEWREPLERS